MQFVTVKCSRFAKLALAIIAIVTLSQFAAAQLLLDDFSTGKYEKSLKSGTDTNTQSGTMIGGNRETEFFVCPPGPCGSYNLFAQPASFQVRPKTKTTSSALIQSAGYKVSPRLDVFYGSSAPLNLDLSSLYDRFRLTFDGSDLGVNFNILVWTGGLYSQTGCNIDASITSFTIDFPFANFTPGQGTPGADFSDLTLMDFIFQSDSGIGGNSWAVTSFQAIPIGAPPGNITCAGLGK
ncbi:MAG: hypothetical protein ACLPHI_05225 [Terriglobales bacterium]|jgi:hypothetical protein